MGRRGPKPQPAAIKAQKGNPGRRPIGADPVTADQSGVAKAPAWLKPEARKIWDRIAPRLIGMKLLGPADAETFARYCKNFALWHKAQGNLDKGLTYEIETASGTVQRVNPAFLIADRLERVLQATEDRFGLNPAERQRIFAARAAGASAAPDLFNQAAAAQPAVAKPASVPVDDPSSPMGFLN